MIAIEKLKQYPLSFKLLEQWIEKQYGSVLFLYNGSAIIKNEDFVEFLDDVKIMIETCAVDGWDNWMFRIIKEDLMSPFFIAYEDDGEYVSRTEATTKAIEKGFELLEQRLKIN